MNRKITVMIGAALLILALGIWIGQSIENRESRISHERDEAIVLPYQSGPYRFDLKISPAEPVVGENRLTLILRDQNGSPISGASISAVAEMPAMGAMQAMRAPAEWRESMPGLYEGSFDLTMKASWPLTLQIEAVGMPPRTIGFDMATGRRGLTPTFGVSGSAQTAMEEVPEGTISIDARRRQMIGLKTASAERRALTHSIRAVGRVNYDETRLTDVSLKYEVWIGELEADFVGKQVRKGDVLFTVYSPDLYAAQQEYLETRRRASSNSTLLKAARQRLKFWDVSDTFIKELEKRGSPSEYITVVAPSDGTVIEKNVIAGSAHRAGMTLLRLADLSRVWIEAEVYEADLSLVTPGMSATATLPYVAGNELTGEVEYIYPYLDRGTRTVRVRFSVDNPNGVLKPDMHADVLLTAQLGERLVVPEEAVLVAGQTRVVFEDLGDGRLAPRRVQTGYHGNGYVEIIDGIDAGDSVVTSGNFLIASESKLKSGLKQW